MYFGDQSLYRTKLYVVYVELVICCSRRDRANSCAHQRRASYRLSVRLCPV